MLEAANENKNLILYTEMINKIMTKTMQKETEKLPKPMAPYTSCADAQCMARIV